MADDNEPQTGNIRVAAPDPPDFGEPPPGSVSAFRLSDDVEHQVSDKVVDAEKEMMRRAAAAIDSVVPHVPQWFWLVGAVFWGGVAYAAWRGLKWIAPIAVPAALGVPPQALLMQQALRSASGPRAAAPAGPPPTLRRGAFPTMVPPPVFSVAPPVSTWPLSNGAPSSGSLPTQPRGPGPGVVGPSTLAASTDPTTSSLDATTHALRLAADELAAAAATRLEAFGRRAVSSAATQVRVAVPVVAKTLLSSTRRSGT